MRWFPATLSVALCLSIFAPAAVEIAAARDPIVALFLRDSTAIDSAAVSPNGRQIASGGEDAFVRLWDIPTGLPVKTYNAQASRVAAVAFSPDGQTILAACSDGKLRLFAMVTGQIVRTFEGHAGEALGIAFSKDGGRILSGGADKTVKLWDAATGGLLKTFEGHNAEVAAVALSADGRRALSGSKDATLHLWDTETGQLVRDFQGHGKAVTSAALSADGALAVSASEDKTVKLWSVAEGKLLRTFEGHSGEALTVAISADGSRILSGSADKTLKLWDTKSGSLLKSLEGHRGDVASAAFLADGGAVLSASLDKTLKLWDLETGQARATFDQDSEAFSPGGHRDFVRRYFPPKITDPATLDKRLSEKGLKRGDPVYLRIFKGDTQAELWIKGPKGFVLFAVYPICAWSGQLGPKLIEGDRQSPEGFYTIGAGQLNPNSRYYRAFNLGFPNLFDRAYARTGANLMIHGACASVGCYAMTDAGMDEIWQLVTAAIEKGQERVAVHVFPFRMTEERMKAFAWHPSAEFWRDLKPAYDLFEETRVPPQVTVCNKRYAVRRGQASSASAPALQAGCSKPDVGERTPLSSAWAPDVRPAGQR